MIRQAHPTTDLTAHITDDWRRDALVIQVRGPQPHGTVALGYAMEDADGQPALVMLPLADDDMRTYGDLDPKPGIRLRYDMAVKIAQAVIAHTKAPADPSEVARLEGELASLRAGYNTLDADLAMVAAERDAARDQVVALERLLEATTAHLEREARTADHFHRPVEMEQEKQAHPQVEVDGLPHPLAAFLKPRD